MSLDIEPALVRIPEGWFAMGCAAGRDDEKPVHRVWVDAFDFAACQVTRADYARFLAATAVLCAALLAATPAARAQFDTGTVNGCLLPVAQPRNRTQLSFTNRGRMGARRARRR